MSPTGLGVDQIPPASRHTAHGMPKWRQAHRMPRLVRLVPKPYPCGACLDPGRAAIPCRRRIPFAGRICRQRCSRIAARHNAIPQGPGSQLASHIADADSKHGRARPRLPRIGSQKFTIRHVGHMTQRLSDTLTCSRSGLDVLVYAFELHPLHFKNRKDSNDRRNPHGAEDDV